MIGKDLSIENERKGKIRIQEGKKNRKENITRETQSRTKENSIYIITKDNTSYALYLKKVQGITLRYFHFIKFPEWGKIDDFLTISFQ